MLPTTSSPSESALTQTDEETAWADILAQSVFPDLSPRVLAGHWLWPYSEAKTVTHEEAALLFQGIDPRDVEPGQRSRTTEGLLVLLRGSGPETQRNLREAFEHLRSCGASSHRLVRLWLAPSTLPCRVRPATTREVRSSLSTAGVLDDRLDAIGADLSHERGVVKAALVGRGGGAGTDGKHWDFLGLLDALVAAGKITDRERDGALAAAPFEMAAGTPIHRAASTPVRARG